MVRKQTLKDTTEYIKASKFYDYGRRSIWGQAPKPEIFMNVNYGLIEDIKN